jgi:hypothetical protein
LAALTLAALALSLAGTLPSTAVAHSAGCNPYAHGGVERTEFPAIGQLREENLPRRIDHYAPPCLVAVDVAAQIQYQWNQRTRRTECTSVITCFPREVHPMGARWDAGMFGCVYVQRQGHPDPYVHAACVRVGHRGQRVTMNLGS